MVAVSFLELTPEVVFAAVVWENSNARKLNVSSRFLKVF
jgi:hypothetical protein